LQFATSRPQSPLLAAFLQVNATLLAAGGVVDARRVVDSSDAIRRLVVDIMSVIGT
jgi:hypothetical protein